jgi:GH15 family glucan-1,4-alpha-glucosidase
MSAVTTDLFERSLHIILDNQQPGGAFLACPTMPDYQFSWFRDGAYISYALTLDGAQLSAQYNHSMAAQWEAAYRFHDWCAHQVISRRMALERAATCVSCGQPLDKRDLLNARYRADGVEGPEDWPEFQLDGPGTWLWSLNEYVRIVDLTPLPAAWEEAVVVTAQYLAALWRLPCYDCWEERSEDVHTSTLGAIYAGLKAAQQLVPSLNYEDVCGEIKSFVLEHCVTPGGELAKSVGIDGVDANLLSVVVPHGMFDAAEPLVVRTVERIERELHAASGGVHRHIEDTYYGGGAWVLLSLHLAWYYIAAGQIDKAAPILMWVEALADRDGYLPEQVNTAMLFPDYYAPWVEQRGTIANPLLWTHAMYMIVRLLMREVAA